MSLSVPAPSVVVAATLLCGITATQGQTRNGDPVMEWNRLALDATTAEGSKQGPVEQLRTMAIVNVAIHDAINGLTRQYRTYLPTGSPLPGASPAAAAIVAAHRVLSQLFPGQSGVFGTARIRSLAAHGVRESDPGVRFGEAVASAVLARQSRDGYAQAQAQAQAQVLSLSSNGMTPGMWTLVGPAPAMLPGLGKVTTWVLRSAAQFRPGRPPALDGSTYARDYSELKAIGSLTSVKRTREQTAIAQFWLAPPAEIWNDVARQAVLGRGFDLSASARALALMYLAAHDTSIASWDAKYTYLFWRPSAAIRHGGADGNETTIGDLTWQPLAESHQHPEYPSGDAAHSAAMGAILSAIFGEKPGIRLVATSPAKPGLRRTWLTFKEGVDEVIDARVYAGVHFRTSGQAGARLGYQVAQFVRANALQPMP